MKTKNNQTIEDILKSRYEDFVNILTFVEASSVANQFGGDVESYITAKKEFVRFHKDYSAEQRALTVGKVYSNIAKFNMAGLGREILRAVFGHMPNDNRWMSTTLYLPMVEKLRDRPHGNYKVKGVRHFFTAHYTIGDAALRALFGDSRKLKKALNAESDFYTARQREIIFKHILKGKDMTKTEKENLKIECEKGLHGLPYDVLVKDAEKKERSEKKRKLTLAKKAAKATLKEYAEMQMKIQALEAENARLKALKDLNSDMPAAHPYDDELNMKSEVPDYWDNYDREGPRYRTDGTPLHRKCLPGLWMTAEQYADFLEKKDDPEWCFEDDFEAMWMGYCMTEEEAEAEEAKRVADEKAKREGDDK